MRKEEIKSKIGELNNQLETMTTGYNFLLNQTVVMITKQIQDLQNICEHEFDADNVCSICGKKRKFV